MISYSTSFSSGGLVQESADDAPPEPEAGSKSWTGPGNGDDAPPEPEGGSGFKE